MTFTFVASRGEREPRVVICRDVPLGASLRIAVSWMLLSNREPLRARDLDVGGGLSRPERAARQAPRGERAADPAPAQVLYLEPGHLHLGLKEKTERRMGKKS